VPELQEFDGTGQKKNPNGNVQRFCLGKKKKHKKHPENDIEKTSQGIIDPGMGRAGINLCIKPYWNY